MKLDWVQKGPAGSRWRFFREEILEFLSDVTLVSMPFVRNL